MGKWVKAWGAVCDSSACTHNFIQNSETQGMATIFANWNIYCPKNHKIVDENCSKYPDRKKMEETLVIKSQIDLVSCRLH